MQEEIAPKKPRFMRARVWIMTAAATGAGLVSTVSAGNITDGISPVITDVTELLPLMLDLVIAALPIIVALAVSSDAKVSGPVDRVPSRPVRRYPVKN